MKSCAIATLVTLAIIVSVLESGQAQENVLPDAFCSYLAFMFRKEDCLKQNSILCRIIGFKFNTSFGGRAFCPQFTCEGYGAEGHECRGIFGCPIGKIRTKGICPFSKVCCSLE